MPQILTPNFSVADMKDQLTMISFLAISYQLSAISYEGKRGEGKAKV
jgi:hypothetical protein